jgi:Arc/MetJ-type ribon-helix-helix transcriptional regulator
LKELVSEKSIDQQDVEVRFYGDKSVWLKKKIEDFSLSGIIKINERVSRKEIIQRQNESQILLLICWNNEKGWYPLKLFGYLAAQRPILVVGGSGKDAIESLIKETGSGKYCKNSEEIKQAIKEWYSEYKNKGKADYEGNLKQIRKYSYEEKAREFALLLDRTQS